MKSILKCLTEKQPTWPSLYKSSSNAIYLVIKEGGCYKGVCVNSNGSGYPLGRTVDNLDTIHCTLYEGEVILSNE